MTVRRGKTGDAGLPIARHDPVTVLMPRSLARPLAPGLEQSSVPPAELKSLLEDVTEALDLALQGRREEGWWCLQIGVDRARSLVRSGQAWAAELVERYEFALDQYERRFPAVSVVN